MTHLMQRLKRIGISLLCCSVFIVHKLALVTLIFSILQTTGILPYLDPATQPLVSLWTNTIPLDVQIMLVVIFADNTIQAFVQRVFTYDQDHIWDAEERAMRTCMTHGWILTRQTHNGWLAIGPTGQRLPLDDFKNVEDFVGTLTPGIAISGC